MSCPARSPGCGTVAQQGRVLRISGDLSAVEMRIHLCDRCIGKRKDEEVVALMRQALVACDPAAAFTHHAERAEG